MDGPNLDGREDRAENLVVLPFKDFLDLVTEATE
jgi:hypothetical protein